MSGSSSPKAEGELALALLDTALSKQPKHDGHDFAAVTEHLCTMRDLLIERSRKDGGARDRLDQLNAIISTALAGHFPLGNAPWPEIERARGALSTLLGDV